MTARVLVVGDPLRTRLPPAPAPDGWAVAWAAAPSQADLGDADLVLFDLTSTSDPAAVADLAGRTADLVRAAVADGPADLPGVEVIDPAAHPDPFAEAVSRFDRLAVAAKARWLQDLGDEAFLREFLGLALDEGRGAADGIAAAAAGGDAAEAGRLAHRLKSTAGNAGAVRAAAAAARVEAAAAAGDIDGVRALAGEVVRAWGRAETILAGYCRADGLAGND